MIECHKQNCKESRCIVDLGQPLKYRLAKHRGYVINQAINPATGAHFNLPAQ